MKVTGVRDVVVRSLPLLVLAATAAILLLHYQQTARLKEKVFESLVLERHQQQRTRLKRLFDPVISNLSIAGRWVQAESPDISNAKLMNSRFISILEEVTQISSAIMADSEGREYMLLRTQEGWLTRLIDVPRQGNRSQWNRWLDTGQSVEAWQESLDYDPRKRPWYRGAIDSGDRHPVFWTPPYRFFTTKQPGITASSRWPHSSLKNTFLVVAFDVLLNDLSAFTMELTAGENEKAFILTGNGQVVGLPDDPQFRNPATMAASVLSSAETFPVAMVRDVYAAWLAGGRPDGGPFTFTTSNDTWWASIWNYALADQSLWLGVTVPEVELISRLDEPRYTVPVTIAGIGLMLFLLSFVAMRRYQHGFAGGKHAVNAHERPMSYSGNDSTALPERLRDLIRKGESERLEFKSSVRWNFKAGRTGKEMELAWLKTVVAYLNSEGGVILLGVNDAGEILGLNKDGFANDDNALRHTENLVARHIGSTHFPYIRSRIVKVNDKKVLMITCDSAPKPVFLKHDKGEDFYIRTGPASRSLAPSEALAYIETRKRD